MVLDVSQECTFGAQASTFFRKEMEVIFGSLKKVRKNQDVSRDVS
jgi:hypothetical protein